jgi:hypothetical protein
MLGSAIPKRWVVSLALVGLVSLFMASFAPEWASPASAASSSSSSGGNTVAGAPTGVTAVAGDSQATVSWTAPASNGGAAITSYTVSASPGSATATTSNGSTLTIAVTGLTNGTAYTFTVKATNSVGDSAASSASSAVTPVDVPTGQVLTNLIATSSLSLQAGQVVALTVSPIDDNGNVDQNMPNITYQWHAGSCGVLSSTSIQSPIFTANGSSCTGQVYVRAVQGNSPAVPASGLIISVSVASPPATAAPAVVPVDPAVIPVIVPAGLTAEDVSVILPSVGGAFSIPQVEGDTGAPVAISIPGGAIDSGTASAVNIVLVSPADVPNPPASATEGLSSNTFKFGSTIIDIQWYDDEGSPLSTFKLNKPAQICVPFIQADVDGADGGPNGLSIWRYNGTEWVELNSTVNVSNGTVCANTSNFSSFALGLAVEAPSEEVVVPGAVGLPVTGGYAPDVSSLILAMLAGFALIGTGVFTARRARRARQNV